MKQWNHNVFECKKKEETPILDLFVDFTEKSH